MSDIVQSKLTSSSLKNIANHSSYLSQKGARHTRKLLQPGTGRQHQKKREKLSRSLKQRVTIVFVFLETSVEWVRSCFSRCMRGELTWYMLAERHHSGQRWLQIWCQMKNELATCTSDIGLHIAQKSATICLWRLDEQAAHKMKSRAKFKRIQGSPTPKSIPPSAKAWMIKKDLLKQREEAEPVITPHSTSRCIEEDQDSDADLFSDHDNA